MELRKLATAIIEIAILSGIIFLVIFALTEVIP